MTLSQAQELLFNTPHLANVTRPETLRYAYVQIGPDAFTDKVKLHVNKIDSDGAKDLSFDYLTGPHHAFFPEIDGFHGNPLVMLVLEQDVVDMSKALGLSQAALRNQIRASFLQGAKVAPGTVTIDGKSEPATVVTVQPFAGLERLQRIASLQAKTYAFTLSNSVPGMLDEITIHTPADPALQAPALTKTLTFQSVEP